MPMSDLKRIMKVFFVTAFLLFSSLNWAKGLTDDFEKSNLPIELGETRCLSVGKKYLVTTEVRINNDGTCFENPNFKLEKLEKRTSSYGVTECYASFWSPVIGYKDSIGESRRELLLAEGAVQCNGLLGPGCRWHPLDDKADIGPIRMSRLGVTQNGLIHDACMAYNYYDPITFKKREGFKTAQHPFSILFRHSIDSEHFEKHERSKEICVDEFAWAMYDLTGIKPNETVRYFPEVRNFFRYFNAMFLLNNAPAAVCTGEQESSYLQNPQSSENVDTGD